MTRLREAIRKAGASDATALIVGESGSGKEIIARSIHKQSRRRDFPFVPVVCSEYAESLLESELFGIEKRAASGVDARAGLFQQASGGTIFLDEIHTTPASAQVKLLRFLQERVIRPVGAAGPNPLEVDIRVLVATNQNLRELAGAGKFREDLLYRLAVLIVEAPPLRSHREDMAERAQHFAAKYAARDQKKSPGFSEGAIRLLAEQAWLGNVRELQNVIDRAVSEMDSCAPTMEQHTIDRALRAESAFANLGMTSGVASPESSDVIADLVFDDLSNERIPLEGIKNRSRTIGAVAECLIKGLEVGFRQFLESDRGHKLLENLSASDILSRVGLSSRRGGSNAFFISRLRDRLSAIIEESKRAM